MNLYKKDTKYLTYKEFVDKELILFSHADLSRSVPGMVDGLKPGQRKILYTFFTKYKSSKKEIKVAQASGGVSEHSAYHHGEVSLQTTIIGMAQNFVGSNNLNLLMPNGQFGTRLQGGKDAASPRYIFTQISPLARLLFPPEDDNLLKRNQDDGKTVEPEWYCPIIPLVLINGSDGIGTGWSTKIPNHDIREVCENIKRMIRGEDPIEMHPKYKNYRGSIDKFDENRYMVNGEIAELDDTTVEVTELPVKTWTQNYMETVLDQLEKGREVKDKEGTKKVDVGMIKSYHDYSTDTTIRFVVEFASASKLKEAKDKGLHKFLKVQSTMTHENTLTLFDHNGCLQRYKSTTEILKDFFGVRMQKYVERKEYLIGLLTAEFDRLANQVRFIREICEKKLVVTNKKKAKLLEMMKDAKYEKDPLEAWKESRMSVDEKRQAEEEENEGEEDDEASKSQAKIDKEDKKGYGYLLSMPIWSLTLERKEKLEKQMEDKNRELEKTKKTTKEQFWLRDLTNFEEALDKLENKEKKEEQEDNIKLENKANKSKVKKGMSFSTGRSKKIILKKDSMPAEDGIRIEPKYDAPKTRKSSGEAKAKKEEAAKLKKEKAEKIKKEKEDKVLGKNSKKLVDYGFTKGVTTKMEKVDLDDSDGAASIDTKKGKQALKTKPGKSALKKEAARRDLDKKPPKKRKKLDWESDSDEEESDQNESDGSVSLTDEDDFAVKLPSRKTAGGSSRTKKASGPINIDESEEDAESEIEEVPKSKSKSKPKAAPKKPAKKHVISSDDDQEQSSEDEMAVHSSQSSEEEIVPKARSRPTRVRKTIKVIEESTEEDDEEESSEPEDDDDDTFHMVD